MLGLVHRNPQPVCELDPTHIFGGIIIGDNWVEAVVMHVDPMGYQYPIRSTQVQFERVNTAPRPVPPPAAAEEGPAEDANTTTQPAEPPAPLPVGPNE